MNHSVCTGCGKCLEVCCYDALALSGKMYSPADLLEKTSGDMRYFSLGAGTGEEPGGLTFSGGEPLGYADFIRDFCALIPAVHIALATSGYGGREDFEKILDCVDLFLFDIKVMNPEEHKKYCGRGNERILDNLDFLYKKGKRITLRLPLIPGINDSEEHFAGIAELLRKYPEIQRAEILPYHNFGIAKAEALGLEISPELPRTGAGQETGARWLEKFSALGCGNISFALLLFLRNRDNDKFIFWKEMDMQSIKRSFVVSLMILAAGLAFAGGRGDSASGGGKANLLVSVWAGPHADLQKQVSREFSGGIVTIDDVDYGNLKQKQLTSFQAVSGSGNYDVVWVNSQWMKEYVDAGYIIPIDDYIKSAGVDTAIYAKGLLEGCVFNGKTYGLPTFAQTLILAYDSEAFAKAGVKVPRNAEELVEAARYFKQHGSGIAIPARQGTAAVTLFSQLLFSDGGYYFDRNGKLVINSPEAIYAATVYDRLVDNALEGARAWHHDETAEAVRMKNAPIGTIMSGLANQNADPERSLIVNTVKYAPLTGKSGKAAATNSFWVWAVAKNAANPRAAANYCIWMTSSGTEKKQTLADQQISAINALSGDQEVLAKAPFLPVVMEQLANGRIDPPLVSFNALKADLVVALSEIAATSASPAEVLGRLQKKYENTDFSK